MHLPRRVAALLAAPWAPYALALAAQLVFAGYVKDDAYIEYRYATNAAHGHGLVFNVGDPPVEGFTSFLWTVGLIVPALLHVPLLVLCKVVSALALGGILRLTAALVEARGGDARAAQLGRWLAATNASLLVWAQSGMEPVVCALAVLGAVYALERRRHWAAMLLAAAAAGLRPECHLVLLGAAAVVVRRRDPAPALAALALVGGMHLWRWHYYGALVPNTALVKGGGLIWRDGLRALGELGVTSLGGVALVFAAREAWARRDDVALLCAGALALFCVYLVRIGRDEMFLARLFLPVWPLALALAAPRLSRTWRVVPLAVCLTGLGFVGGRLHTVGYWALGERSHVPLGHLMSAHARPGDLVVYQDLGQTPWAAMELRFVDPIGLVDSTIAHIRWSERASPFSRMPSLRGVEAIRDHLFALHPKLVCFVAYVPDQIARDVRARYEAARSAADKAALFAPFCARNPYYVGLFDDPRFSAFRFVDVIRRKDNYWLVLYERA